MGVVLERAQTAPARCLDWHMGGAIWRMVLAHGQVQGAVHLVVRLEPFPDVADLSELGWLLAMCHELLVALLGLAGYLLRLGPGLAERS